MSKQLTHKQAEEILTRNYVNKIVSFTYPGYDPVYGKVDEISIDTTHDPEVVIQMNDTRYTCSPESLKQCLKLL